MEERDEGREGGVSVQQDLEGVLAWERRVTVINRDGLKHNLSNRYTGV